MKKNYAFIDAQNLYLQMKKVWWKIDYRKFAKYLKSKHKVEKVYMFLWYIPENKKIYNNLKNDWYELIFKETIKYKDWTIKWNVDAELVLQTMIDYEKYDKALIISWDGDFACLIKYLDEQNKLKLLLVPDNYNYSWLLKKAAKGKIANINDLKNKIEYK